MRGLVVLCLSMLVTPVRAQLEVFERLVMPGPVVAGHAEYESDCGSCHVRFSRESQRTLCLDCHEDIAADITNGTGFHGLAPDVGDRECAACHTDHEGRDADITGLVAATFNHEFTSFPLRDSHREAACGDCHQADQSFHTAETECVACHLDDDRHLGNLGDVCSDCHRETDWADAFYDHELSSGFALTGAHGDLSCVSCHVSEVYVETPTTCVGCHRLDDSHMGTNGSECRNCHTTASWAETTFDHSTSTAFALVGSHSGISCDSCHTGNKFEVAMPTQCIGCHREDDAHDGINGTECAACHRETEWLDVRFDHAVDTAFPLNGAHAEVACSSCHREAVAVSLPANTCIGCHDGDDPHARQLGEDCASCHSELLWTEDVRFDHDLGQFPLLGVHAGAACDACHASPAFLDAPEQCVDCHAEDDVHDSRFGSDCGFCHSPVDWLVWRFDHDRQTEFPLDGVHRDLECSGCHRDAVTALAEIELATDCASCHRADDVHRGAFGDDCGVCHRPTSFGDLRAIQ